jgi:hypothetical protein
MMVVHLSRKAAKYASGYAAANPLIIYEAFAAPQALAALAALRENV